MKTLFKSLFLVTAFEDENTLSLNLQLNKDLIKWMNLWNIQYTELLIQVLGQSVIALMISERDYNTSIRYNDTIQEVAYA